MDRVFIYWDNSNIFHEAQRLAEERSEGPNARYRIRVHFDNMLRLAHADRPIERALAVGSVPPEMRQLWNRMESNGIEVRLFDRGSRERGEQEMPDRLLQLRMLEDALDYNGSPGIVVLLTGDGPVIWKGLGFTALWNGCTGAVGVSRFCPGCTPAISVCAAGPRATGCSCPWTTSTTPLLSWSPPDPASSSPKPATLRPSICPAAR